MFSLKATVDARGLKPEAVPILIVAAEVFREQGYDCVVTSLTDSKHTAKSLHGLGYSVDFRTKHIDPAKAPTVVPAIMKAMAARLGPQYQVVTEVDHIHAEFDPRALLAQ